MLAALGIVFTVMSAGDLIDSCKTPLNYNLMSVSDIKDGAIVEGNLFANLGSYEEYYTTGRFGGKTGSSSYWYLIPVGEEEFMGFYTGNQDLISALDRQANETWASLDDDTVQPTPIHFKGKIVKMDAEDENYFRNGMLDCGFTLEEVQGYGIKSYIKVVFYDNLWIPLTIGSLTLLIGASILIIMFIRKRQGL